MLITTGRLCTRKTADEHFYSKSEITVRLLSLLLLLLLLPDRVQFNFSMLTQLNRPACLLGPTTYGSRGSVDAHSKFFY